MASSWQNIRKTQQKTGTKSIKQITNLIASHWNSQTFISCFQISSFVLENTTSLIQRKFVPTETKEVKHNVSTRFRVCTANITNSLVVVLHAMNKKFQFYKFIQWLSYMLKTIENAFDISTISYTHKRCARQRQRTMHFIPYHSRS